LPGVSVPVQDGTGPEEVVVDIEDDVVGIVLLGEIVDELVDLVNEELVEAL
jgi:hypothetical protein